ncbi:MAG: tyrosine-type recombinase/integrase [Candidatus Ozemobacteraceae bacterium]
MKPAPADLPPSNFFFCPTCDHPLKINPFAIKAEWRPCGLKKEFVKFVETPSFPPDRPKAKFIELIGKAIGIDIQFLARHPTTLFQCLWNSCWWYDCPAAAEHYLPLPKGLDPEDVDKLLADSKRSTKVGLRDHAVLLLLARLGLRAGEIVAMMLDDVDWDSGVLMVRGKGSRRDKVSAQ